MPRCKTSRDAGRSPMRGHRIFAGKLDRSKLGFAQKAIVIALRAPEGDFRDWEAVRGWAREVALDLAQR